MFKKLFALVALLSTSVVFAAGPSQIWRLEITAAEEGVVEIAELELIDRNGQNVVDLIRTYTHEQTVGSNAWTVSHNLNVQTKMTSGDVQAVKSTPQWIDQVTTESSSQPDTSTSEVGDFWFDTNNNNLKTFNGVVFYEVLLIDYTVADIAARDALTPTNREVARVLDSDGSGTQAVYQFFDNGIASDWIEVQSPTATMDTVAPVSPIDGTIWYDTANSLVKIWEVEADIEPTSFVPLDENTVQVTFDEPATGTAFVRGISFDTPAADKPGKGLPPVEGIENRPAATVFDNNKSTWFKSTRAPTANNPLAVQYTFWVGSASDRFEFAGEDSQFPEVVEYRITARDTESAPRAWRLMFWKEGQWHTAHSVATAKFFEKNLTNSYDIE